MRICDLFDGIEYKTELDVNTEINRVVSDSRRVTPASLFVCIRGERRDGHAFACEAFLRGAAAVVSEREIRGVPCIVVRDTREADAFLQYNLFGKPDHGMKLVAITGTNGKTSTAQFLYSILRAAGKKTGALGTLGAELGGERLEVRGSETEDIAAAMTTPDPEFLYGTLQKMRENGTEYVVMEASSHAIAQKKLAPLTFELGIFTNLSPEHLDYHISLENYFETKASMFGKCRSAAVSCDTEFGERLARRFPHAHTVSLDDAEGLRENGGIEYKYKGIEIYSPIAAEFNVQNTMLAAEAALTLGIDEKFICRGISRLQNIDGRMEKIISAPFSAYIDYAHTPEAMRRAVSAAKRIAGERCLTVLFGCGGNRDREKRPLMGRAAEAADNVIVTSDNSRDEDPEAIIREILSGMTCPERARVIISRREAIEYAVREAHEGEVILLLGKGHETHEIQNNRMTYFSEREILHDALKRRLDN